MFAIAAHADEREADVREVERFGRTLPEDSYGRRNRQDVAAHETRVAARLRAVEQAYRTAIDHDTAYSRRPHPDTTAFLSISPASRLTWRPSRDPRNCSHQRQAKRERHRRAARYPQKARTGTSTFLPRPMYAPC